MAFPVEIGEETWIENQVVHRPLPSCFHRAVACLEALGDNMVRQDEDNGVEA